MFDYSTMALKQKLRNYHGQYKLFLNAEVDSTAKDKNYFMKKTKAELPQDLLPEFRKIHTDSVHEHYKELQNQRSVMSYFEEVAFAKAYPTYDDVQKEFVVTYLYVCEMYLDLTVRTESKQFFNLLKQDILNMFEPVMVVESTWNRLCKAVMASSRRWIILLGYNK